MPIQNQPAAAMPAPFTGGGAAIHVDAVAAVNALTYANLWGGPGLLTNSPRARLDLQGYTGAGEMNLQVQVNGIGAPSTMATVLVAPTVRALLPPNPRSSAQQTEVVRVVKSALFNSLNDFEHANARIWTVTGTPSS